MINNSLFLYYKGLLNSIKQFLGLSDTPGGQSGGLLSPLLEFIRLGHVSRWVKGPRVLDCGCGRGQILNMLNKNIEYTGVDSDVELIEYLNREYPNSDFICSTIENVLTNLENEKYDCIVMAAIIEHVEEPELLIKNLKKLLTENGRIIVTTPNPIFEKLYEFGAKIGFFDHHADEDHEKLISMNSLKKFSENSNLSIIRFYKFLFGANQIIIYSNE